MKIKLLAFCMIISAWACTNNKNKRATPVFPPAGKGQSLSDSCCLFHKISWSTGIDLSNEFNIIDQTFLYKNNLYLLCSFYKKVLVMNTVSGEITKPDKLNAAINSLSKILRNPNELYITNDFYYIGFDRGIAVLDKSYGLKLKVSINGNFKYLGVANDGSILAFNEADSIVTLFRKDKFANNDTIPTKKGALDLVGDHFCKSNDGIYGNANFLFYNVNSGEGDFTKTQLDKDVIGYKKFRSPFIKNYPAFITPNYIFWFPYVERDKLIVTDVQFTKVVKTVEFNGNNFAVAHDDLINEQGQPDCFVDVDGDDFYVSSKKNNTIVVYKGRLGLMK